VTLAITGWGVLSSTGIGAEDFSSAVTQGRGGLADVRGMFDEPLPEDQACVLVGFRARDHLGRKGTSFLDRSTALALVGCDAALADADLCVDDGNRDRVGIVLGTTAGSIRSTSEYSRETLVQDKPYLVNPVLFPNAVMNCAAGQCAIWHRLKGVNATVAGGQIAGLNVLRYARNVLQRDYADALLVGAVEEFSPQVAWGTRCLHAGEPERVPLGEGAVVFLAEDARRARAAGRAPDAEVLAVEVGLYAPPGEEPDPGRGLAACIERALDRAGVAAPEVWAVASGERGVALLDDVERHGIASAIGPGPRRLRVKELVGECHAASGAFQLAALLGHHRGNPALDGRVSVVTSCSADGAVGAAVVRGWSRARGDHGQ
jgi:3-oxoacyl-[acyl-carrier-protein] synthase II